MVKTLRPTVVGAVLALALIGGGLILWFSTGPGGASFGWYSYEPQIVTTVNAGILWEFYGRPLVAAVLVVLGFSFGGALVGFNMGRRTGWTETASGPDPFSHPGGK